MLDVAVAPVSRVEQLLLVRHTVAVGVGVLPHLLRVRLLGEQRVGAERQEKAREDQVVDKHRVLVVLAVVIGINVERDAAIRIVFARRVCILHVAAVFEHEHARIAIKRDGGGFLDDGIRQHQLEPVAGLHDEFVQLLVRRERRHRRLL